MIKDKLLTLSMAGAMSLGMATGVFAAPVSDTVPVSYDNSKEIGVPTEPDWAVQIPAAVVFTDTVKSVDVGVELIGKNGVALPTGIKAEVSVASANEYKMINAKNASEVDYSVQYAGQAPLTGAAATMFVELTETNLELDGTAKMNGVANTRGEYVDTLTYSVVRTA